MAATRLTPRARAPSRIRTQNLRIKRSISAVQRMSCSAVTCARAPDNFHCLGRWTGLNIAASASATDPIDEQRLWSDPGRLVGRIFE